MKDARSPHRERPKARYSESQIRDFLRRIDAGEEKSVVDACRNFGVSRQAYYCWRAKYRHLASQKAEIERLRLELGEIRRRLEQQNRTLASLRARVADEVVC